jgi:hypothetical protein
VAPIHGNVEVRVTKLLAIVVLELAFSRGVEAQGTYATNFPLTENPISEAGHWINGQAVGLDWKDVRTTPGLAFGADASGTPNYNDPTALLTGGWGPNQTAEAAVRTVNQRSGNVYEEVELRLRSAISAHRNTGYEINFRCTHDGSQYVQIVRWNGPLGDFTYVQSAAGPGLFNGDVVKATIAGNVITAYINGTQITQGIDGTYATGNPGIGFYLHGAPGLNGDFGFTSFTASDGGFPQSPPSPKNLRIIGSLGPHDLNAALRGRDSAQRPRRSAALSTSGKN